MFTFCLFVGLSLGDGHFSLCGVEYPCNQCIECPGDNDGCPCHGGHVSICGGYGVTNF